MFGSARHFFDSGRCSDPLYAVLKHIKKLCIASRKTEVAREGCGGNPGPEIGTGKYRMRTFQQEEKAIETYIKLGHDIAGTVTA